MYLRNLCCPLSNRNGEFIQKKQKLVYSELYNMSKLLLVLNNLACWRVYPNILFEDEIMLSICWIKVNLLSEITFRSRTLSTLRNRIWTFTNFDIFLFLVNIMVVCVSSFRKKKFCLQSWENLFKFCWRGTKFSKHFIPRNILRSSA